VKSDQNNDVIYSGTKGQGHLFYRMCVKPITFWKKAKQEYCQ